MSPVDGDLSHSLVRLGMSAAIHSRTGRPSSMCSLRMRRSLSGKVARLRLEQVPHRVAFRRIAAVRSGAEKEMSRCASDFLARNFRVGREAARLAH